MAIETHQENEFLIAMITGEVYTYISPQWYCYFVNSRTGEPVEVDTLTVQFQLCCHVCFEWPR